VSNSGGSLFGPNGANLGPAGCIEVYIVLTYHYVATITKCTGGTVGVGGQGGPVINSSTSSCISYEVTLKGCTSVGPQEVCPC
jgi:hypothetical protein